MNNEYKAKLKDIGKIIAEYLITLSKWLFASAIIGAVAGLIGFGFGWLLEEIGILREEIPWLLYFLPLSGVAIMLLYRVANEQQNKGTNLVISAIHSDERVPVRILPLIFSGTLLSHLCGASVGREGAALQMGGSIGNQIAALLKMDAKDTKILIMAGMSACFAALFGTPVTAAIFSIEVVSVGIMHYAALVPCIMSSIIASGIARALGLAGERFIIEDFKMNYDTLGSFAYGKIIILGLICAVVSILFITVLHNTEHILKDRLKNPYIRIFLAGATVILFTAILETDDFLGSGISLINSSFHNSSPWYYFLLKIVFTSLCIGSGYKGGEIIPSLCIGATLGSCLSLLLNLPTDLCAACGMVGVFVGVTNCPISTMLLAIEMFGIGNLNFYAIIIAICYLLSGYYSLYNSQKFMYSKTRTEYINKTSL